jgi:hypothetical protein
MKYGKLSGIEYLRTIMSLFVVVWHMQLFGGSSMGKKNFLNNQPFSIVDVFYFNVALLAVPTFIFISCFLYSLKPRDFSDLKRKISRIVIPLFFWSVAFNLNWLYFFGTTRLNLSTLSDTLITLLRGGNTPYYFFVSLSLCILTSHSIQAKSSKSILLYFVVSILLLSAFPIISIKTGALLLAVFWNPLNFIPLVFAATLISRHFDVIAKYIRLIFPLSLIIYIGLAIIEWYWYPAAWFFSDGGMAMPAYTRSSLVIGAITISVLAIHLKPKLHSLIKTLSLYSLSLYCIHPILIWPNKIHLFYTGSASLTAYMKFLIIILASYLIAWLLKHLLPRPILF